ncbi:MAG: hypothetical protein JXJ04_11350 [Spirochaetales bacterium]|nr:hypothetical protein [Spirochaetales bacterium]
MLLSDLHIHSNFSDGKHSIHDIVTLYGNAGFDVIAITDHITENSTFIGRMSRKLNKSLTPDTFALYIETINMEAVRAWREYGMIVIPGMEITKNSISPFKSAHIVALNITEPICADNDSLIILKEIREMGGLSIAAHPVFTQRPDIQTFHLWARRNELKDYVDVWELGNKCFFAKNAARKTGFPFMANSDFHHYTHLTSWKTLIDAKRNKEDILNALKKQQIKCIFFNTEERKIQRLVSDYVA